MFLGYPSKILKKGADIAATPDERILPVHCQHCDLRIRQVRTCRMAGDHGTGCFGRH